jgi:hypothetical protein
MPEEKEALLRAERRTALWFWDGDFEVRNNYDCDEITQFPAVGFLHGPTS